MNIIHILFIVILSYILTREIKTFITKYRKGNNYKLKFHLISYYWQLCILHIIHFNTLHIFIIYMVFTHYYTHYNLHLITINRLSLLIGTFLHSHFLLFCFYWRPSEFIQDHSMTMRLECPLEPGRLLHVYNWRQQLPLSQNLLVNHSLSKWITVQNTDLWSVIDCT